MIELEELKERWSIVIQRVSQRSYTYLPNALDDYAEARIKTTWGTLDEPTRLFVEAAKWHSKRREWDEINNLVAEYRDIITFGNDRFMEKFCPECGRTFKEGKWRCFDCKTRRRLRDVGRMDATEARMTLAWNDWRLGIESLKELTKERDTLRIERIVERVARLVREEVEHKHTAIDNFSTATKWMLEREYFDQIWEFSRKMLLIFAELPSEQICGGVVGVCPNYKCKFRFEGEFNTYWVCPRCGAARGLCMFTFTNEIGRCPIHTTNGSYYRFVNANLADTYDRFVNDPDLVSTQRQIALLDTRVNQLTESLDGVDPLVLKKGLQTVLDEATGLESSLEQVMNKEETDPEEVESITRELLKLIEYTGNLVDSASVEQIAWQEIGNLLHHRKNQIDSEVKKQIAQQYTIPIGAYVQGLTQLASMFVSRLSLVQDTAVQTKIRELVSSDAQRLLEAEIVDGHFELLEEQEELEAQYEILSNANH